MCVAVLSQLEPLDEKAPGALILCLGIIYNIYIYCLSESLAERKDSDGEGAQVVATTVRLPAPEHAVLLCGVTRLV